MYAWESTTLANYKKGVIVVMANSVEEARTKLLDSLEKLGKEDPIFLSFHPTEKFKMDIECEPDIIPNGIMLIEGSA